MADGGWVSTNKYLTGLSENRDICKYGTVTI
jgi:hypothetical protein